MKVLLALTIATAGPALAGNVRVPCKDPVPGRYIVILNEGTYRAKGSPASAIAPTIPDVASGLSRLYRGRLSAPLEHVLKGFTVSIDDGAARALANDPRVAYVEQGCPVHVASEQTNPPWGLDRVDQSQLPLSSSYVYNDTGLGVNVYVIDTGITHHPEFVAELGFDRLRPGINLYPDDGSAPDPDQTGDCWPEAGGHGTAVAGVIGGNSTGVAKQVYLYPVRVFGCTSDVSNTTVIAEGMDWVAKNHVKPAVANLSITYGPNTSLDTAVQGLVDEGVVAVMAAGNSNADACNFSPARIAAGLTVGGSTPTDRRRISSPTSGSNYGSCVDLFAPGEQIWAPTKNGSSYAYFTGTSFAAPHVAGAAALYLAGNGDATVDDVNGAILANATYGQLYAPTLGAGSPNALLFAKPTDACFSWSCNPVTKTCNFDPGCSRFVHGLWFYVWNFGDGQQVTTTNNSMTHVYAAQDLYSVTLSVVPTKGGMDDAGACVNVTPLGTTCQASGQTP